ncbi:MAG: esterase-like activity of phytase family protein [Burkholderiales bacterium]|jgi:hypothetical protein
MNPLLRLACVALALAAPAVAPAQSREFPAVLAGHAILQANRMVPPPADAPPGLMVSGRFTGPGQDRTEAIGTLPQVTGLSLPFVGQPLQGFSGIKPAGDGSYWVLTDNGFGSKRNSGDAMLFFSRVTPDWKGGVVTVHQTVFLSDPDRKVPFRIVNEHTRERYLTGADFDPESIQPVADGFWIGEEFGPFLIHVDRQGRVTGVFGTTSEGREIRSPDHPSLQLDANPTRAVPFQSQRSGGYEGMALSQDGQFLYALLEKPLLDAAGQPETAGGKRFLRIIEFSVTRRAWTGREWRFGLEDGVTSIGDFNMVDGRRALIIERDDGEGDPSMACAAATKPGPDNRCFANPARVKRVVMVDLQAPDANGFVRRLGHVDLMAIRDPQNLARLKGEAKRDLTGLFTFPFFTIENVAVVDAEHIIVANDNNLPFSIGRFVDRAADNEFILLKVPELLQAR